MRIKRLELQGFKSFKDKTAIHFDTGITGIVGPNGCGKSNVVDAFFWALGEMNPRNLRGQNMEDLIFSGSDHSPPSNLAEVNLFLEVPADISGPNAPSGASIRDFSLAPLTREIAITRRLYRNAESEYFINKVPCRLKDIQELFMDTGAGARGYSIIQQGKIAEIVNAKPDERRIMIEDVAGVVKYKSRRREAQRKLEATTQNLLRVSDVLNEIEQRKRQMERQAEKARKYKEWKEELQSIELRHSAALWEDIAEKLGTLDKELSELEIQDASLTVERETADNRMVQKRLEATSAAKVNEEFQQKWFQKSQSLNQAENNHGYQKKVFADISAAIASLEEEVGNEAAHIQDLVASVETIHLDAKGIEDAFSQASIAREGIESKAFEAKSELDGKENLLEKSYKSYLDSTTEIAKSEQRVIANELRLSELDTKISDLSTAFATQSNALNQLREQSEQNEIEKNSAFSSFNDKNAFIQNIVAEIQSAKSLIEQTRKNWLNEEQQKIRMEASIQTIEDQRKRYEGSSIGVQNFFQKILPDYSNESMGKILGTLASLIKVDPGLEIAVEAALGNNLEIVLTKDLGLAKKFSNILKDQAAGRVSFAEITKIADLEKSSLKTAPEGCEPLSQYIHIDSKNAEKNEIEIFLKFLTKNIFVVNTLEDAQALAQNYNDTTFLTRAGELCQGSWLLVGGDSSQISGKLVARNRELAELQEKLTILQETIQRISEELIEKEASLKKLQESLSVAEIERENLRQNHTDLTSRHTVFKAQLQQLESGKATIQRDQNKLEEEKNQLTTDLEQLRNKVQALQEQSKEAYTSWEKIREEIPELRAKAERLQQELLDAKVKEASLLEQKNSIHAQLKNSTNNLNQAEKRIEQLQKQNTDKKEQLTATTMEIEQLDATIHELRIEIVDAEAEYRAAKERLDTIQAELDAYRNQFEDSIKKERSIKDKIGELRIRVERIHLERENISQNILERYGVSIGEYTTNPEVKDQILLLKAQGENAHKDLETDVLRLKEKIRKLGEVNTSAIEEYNELLERFNFLSEQKADLEKSMADLQSAIDKINNISRERFFRAFHEVNSQFTQVFPALFGGGQAQLTLTNPEDFNETGVDIVAQPPGKKLQNINLLSGGEKTLTAISLLFAIFLVKPSPFCLLDEVDAPLDDANIGRFNALLREMSKRSQFIIITHNKRTMELNDKLYGVTMEDAGISKMVSIQLTA